MGSRTRGNDNNEQENQNSDDNTNAHLHIFPPHLLSNSVCTAAKALGRNSQVVRLILESIQALTSIVGFVDVVSQDSHGVVDVLETHKSALHMGEVYCDRKEGNFRISRNVRSNVEQRVLHSAVTFSCIACCDRVITDKAAAWNAAATTEEGSTW